MVNRPANKTNAKSYERADEDWYIEPAWTVHQLMDAIFFPDGTIYDPCCGGGNILNVAKERGFATIGSDIINRAPSHPFTLGNALRLRKLPNPTRGRLSVITNSPFSNPEKIGEQIVRHIVGLNPYRAAFCFPIAFLCSIDRYRFFTEECVPSHICVHSQRPTMPPGAKINELSGTGGMGDYIWLIYTRGHEGPPAMIWLKPDSIV